MAYEHDHTGNRPLLREPVQRDQHGFRREGSGGPGLAIVLGAIIIALIVAIYSFWGSDTRSTMPAPTAPVATEPAADPASDPAGAIPGVDPMVPVQPEQPAGAPAE